MKFDLDCKTQTWSVREGKSLQSAPVELKPTETRVNKSDSGKSQECKAG